MKHHQLVVDSPDDNRFSVPRAAMSSPDVFDRERHAIFDRSWLYIGHTSEIPERGSFVRRAAGGRPLILLRGQDNQIRAFFNSCPHRGAMICRQDMGTTKTFQCFYHAWTFDTSGQLVGLPDKEGYGDNWDRSRMGMTSPPRLAEYRGLIFVSYDARIEPLVEYLADARYYLDLILDQSNDRMRIVEGSQKYSIGANWKLMVENSLDGYHAPPLHSTYFAYAAPERTSGVRTKPPIGRARSLGNGHSVMLAHHSYPRPVARWNPVLGDHSRRPIAETRRRLQGRFGVQRAFEIAELTKNILIYPNLVVNDGVSVTVRKIDPVSTSEMDITAWALAPSEEPDDLLAIRLDSFLTFYGPGGFATPDDLEALESCQRGFASGSPQWSDISRGMNREPLHTDEVQMRTFWRHWDAQLHGMDSPEETEARGPIDWRSVEPVPQGETA